MLTNVPWLFPIILFLIFVLKDLLCDDIPTRWSAPESLMHGKFSRMSDSWMLFMTAGEVLEHGRWPLTDHQHSSIEAVIENVCEYTFMLRT